MNKSDEKLKIYAMMDRITEERSTLTDMYLGLLKRLENLDESEKQEMKGLEVVKDTKIEDDFLMQEPSEPVDERTLEEIINEHNQRYNDVVEETLESNKIPKLEIERELDKMPRQKYKPLDTTRASTLICSILKEKGIPMSTKELYKSLSDKVEMNIKESNFRNNILPRVTKSNPRVQKAMRGYYQYK